MARKLSDLRQDVAVILDRLTVRGFDSECLRLAEHFLADEQGITEADKEDLARDIQQAVEDWFFARDSNPGEAA